MILKLTHAVLFEDNERGLKATRFGRERERRRERGGSVQEALASLRFVLVLVSHEYYKSAAGYPRRPVSLLREKSGGVAGVTGGEQV